MMGHHPIMTRGMMEGSKGMMSNESHHTPHEDAKTVLLDVGDRLIDFQCLADRLAALGAQLIGGEAAKSDP